MYDGVRSALAGMAPQHYFDAHGRSAGESDARFAEHVLKVEAARARDRQLHRMPEDWG